MRKSSGLTEIYQVELKRLEDASKLAFASSNPNFPEDKKAVFPLCCAAGRMAEEIIYLVDGSYTGSALRTARTMYECVVFALYISKHPETVDNYLETLNDVWWSILQNVPDAQNTMPAMFKAVQNAVAKRVPSFMNPGSKLVLRLRWNDDNTTYNMARDVGVSDPCHSVAFGYSSAYVHPSPLLMMSHIQQTPDGSFQIGLSNQKLETDFSLPVMHDMLLAALRLRLRYKGNDDLQNCIAAECEADFRSVWGWDCQLSLGR